MMKHAQESEYYWMMVTRDRYELPIFVAESVRELARMVGCSASTIRKNESEGRRYGSKTAYVRVRKKGAV